METSEELQGGGVLSKPIRLGDGGVKLGLWATRGRDGLEKRDSALRLPALSKAGAGGSE